MYQLAVRCGEWDVSKIERGLTAKRFIEWEAYARLEPFNELRADIRSAQIAAMVFNMAVAVKDRKPVSHFLIDWSKGADEAPSKTQPGGGQDWRFKKAIAYAICAAYGAGAKELK